MTPPRARGRHVDVRPGETLAGALARAGEDERATGEGRVFRELRRLEPDACVFAGDRLWVAPSRRATAALRVLARSADLVIASVPAGMPAEADRRGAAGSAALELAERLGVAAGEVHAVSRLDAGTSGLATFAVGARGARLGARLLERGGITRRYWALLAPGPAADEGRWDGPVTTPRGHRSALTSWWVRGRAARARAPDGGWVEPALVELSLATGRFHQIRQHAARGGAPLLGDRRHGGASRLALAGGEVIAVPRVALHAFQVEVDLPGARWVVADAPPEDLLAIWRALGGAPEAWRRAEPSPPPAAAAAPLAPGARRRRVRARPE